MFPMDKYKLIYLVVFPSGGNADAAAAARLSPNYEGWGILIISR